MREQLKSFGFSEKEAAVYVALLELESSLARDIAKRAKVNRSTTYVILDTLAERGLVHALERRGVKIYQAMPPEKLASYLETKAKQYANFSGAAKKLIPELKALHKPTRKQESQPKVQLIEGQEGVKSVYEDTLGSLETIRAYASVENAVGNSKKEVKVQVIFPDTPEAKARIAESKEEAEAAFRVPDAKYGFASEINIYDGKVIFISPQEKFGLIIESKEFADTLKKAFTSARKEVKNLRGSTILKPEKTAEGLA